MKYLSPFAGVLAMLLLFSSSALPQASISVVGPAGAYTQNFDGTFLGTANYNLTNNAAGNLGWYATRQTGNATPNAFVAEAGGTATGQFKNYGTAASTNRALGSLATAADTDTLFYGLRIQNNTGVLIRSVRVQYTGEQWRKALGIGGLGGDTADTLAFSYQVSPGDITSLTTGTFNNVPALNFVTPINSATPAATLNGDAAANRVSLDQIVSVNVPIGGEIMLRWSDIDDTGFDHGLAIDDVSVSFFIPSAAPVSISGRVTTPGGVGIGNAILVLTGGSLGTPRTARTNPFGYYHIQGIEAGAAYLLEVSSKRYTFQQPSRVMTTQDNVTDADFISN